MQAVLSDSWIDVAHIPDLVSHEQHPFSFLTQQPHATDDDDDDEAEREKEKRNACC